MTTLREALRCEPRDLPFGTSGRRGEVVHLTQLEVYINVLAEVRYLLSLSRENGGIRRGEAFYIAHDLRPSSTRFDPHFHMRGEIAQAVVHAVSDAGLHPIHLGPIPTPALLSYAVARRAGSIMVTGSHIPFDRNGYKTGTSHGELRKEDEAPILEHVERVRSEVYEQEFHVSPFDAMGMFRHGHRDLPPTEDDAAAGYLDRYLSFFERQSLSGLRLAVYQHSAVGRDLLVELLLRLGADVVPIGRSDTFIPIDTENIEPETLAEIASMVREAGGGLDAVVSTDGDSDRPLLLGVEPEGGLRFFPGDLLGMVTAEYLGAEAVVVPVTCTDAVERGALADCVEPRTRVGSPYVIAGMEGALAGGKRAVCGWEANGGFLLGSDFVKDGRVLTALPTRDAFLPLLCSLFAARERGGSLLELFDSLPRRFTRSGLIRRVHREAGRIGALKLASGGLSAPDPYSAAHLFRSDLGFGAPVKMDYLDGVRIWFDNGEIAHIRPSGNADELRIFAVADTQERADEIVSLGVREPNGLLHTLAVWGLGE